MFRNQNPHYFSKNLKHIYFSAYLDILVNLFLICDACLNLPSVQSNNNKFTRNDATQNKIINSLTRISFWRRQESWKAIGGEIVIATLIKSKIGESLMTSGAQSGWLNVFYYRSARCDCWVDWAWTDPTQHTDSTMTITARGASKDHFVRYTYTAPSFNILSKFKKNTLIPFFVENPQSNLYKS